MKQKRIKVTQRHIDGGIRENSRACPIAQAFLDCKNVENVMVDGEVVEICEYLKNGLFRRTYKLPKPAGTFVTKFDAGLEVKPFSFKLGRRINGEVGK